MTSPVPLSGGDARTQLAEALTGQPITFEHNLGRLAAQGLADALLPVVERIADERAAEALEAVERESYTDPSRSVQRILQDTAASLRAASRGEEGR